MSVSPIECACGQRFTVMRDKTARFVHCPACHAVVHVEADGSAGVEYYLLVGQEKHGPMSTVALLQAGLRPEWPVWRTGLLDWTPAQDVPELKQLLLSTPPAAPGKPNDISGSQSKQPLPYSVKSFQAFFSWFQVSLIVCLVGSCLCNLLELVSAELAVVFGLLTISSAIVTTVFSSILLYRAWKIIQDGYARTTPGLAVGLNFIPLFWFYWQFVSIHGLAVDMNSYDTRHGKQVSRISEGLALSYCILSIPCGLLGCLPVVGTILVIPTMIVYLVLMRSVTKACQEIAQTQPVTSSH